MTTQIHSRHDLPFVVFHPDGTRNDWKPERCADSPAQGVRHGHDCAQALAQLAGVCEYEAYRAMVDALLAPKWRNTRAEEVGFVEALASAALVGWRAQACGEVLPFAATFDTALARQHALHARVELMEAQLQALRQQPWRSWEEARAD